MAYSSDYTDYPIGTTRPDLGGNFAWLQTLLMQNYINPKPIVIDKEIKGGLHRVKYLSQLYDYNYDGIFQERRAVGMLVYVEREDNDNPWGRYYSLKIWPGTSADQWVEVGSGNVVHLNNPKTVPNLAARDASEVVALTGTATTNAGTVNVNGTGTNWYGLDAEIIVGDKFRFNNAVEYYFVESILNEGSLKTTTPTAAYTAATIYKQVVQPGDFVNVIDARTPAEVTANVDPYPASFIWDGSIWLNIYPYGDNPYTHVQNTDTGILVAGVFKSGDAIWAAIVDTTKHKTYNDGTDLSAAANGAGEEAYTSKKIATELLIRPTVDSVNGNVALFLNQKGTWTAPPSYSDAQAIAAAKTNIGTGADNFAAGNHVHSNATSSTNGFHSKEDKAALGINNTMSALNAFAIGDSSTASGINAVATGYGSKATGANSFASGYSNQANAPYSAAFGSTSIVTATGTHSFAAGRECIVSGIASFAEGWTNTSSGDYGSHSEGDWTTASGRSSHTQNMQTRAVGSYSHAGGYRSRAVGESSFNHSSNTTNDPSGAIGAAGNNSAILGGRDNAVTAAGLNSAVIGGTYLVNSTPNSVLVPKLIVHTGIVIDSLGNSLLGGASIDDTTASLSTVYSSTKVESLIVQGNGYTDNQAIAAAKTNIGTGPDNFAAGNHSHANATGTTDGFHSKEDKASLGVNHTRIGTNAFTLGDGNTASGINSVAMGNGCIASHQNTIASGFQSQATEREAHAFGYLAKAKGWYSFATNLNTNALGRTSFAEGWLTTAEGDLGCHSEGNTTVATGDGAHAQNGVTRAIGPYSHSGGRRSRAVGDASFNHSVNANQNDVTKGALGYASAILAGQNNTVGVDSINSAVIGGSDLTNNTPNSVMVPMLIVSTGQIVDSNGTSLVGQGGGDVYKAGNNTYTGVNNFTGGIQEGGLALSLKYAPIGGGGGGDVYLAGNNTFTGNNKFTTDTLFPSWSSYNVGTAGDATYERMRGYWSGNKFYLFSESSGAPRDIIIGNSYGYQVTIPGSPDISGVFKQSTSFSTNTPTSEFGVTANYGNSAGVHNGYAFLKTITQSGTAGYRGFFASPFEITTGTGPKLLIDLGTNSAADGGGTHTPKFTVDTAGNTKAAGDIYEGGTTLSVKYGIAHKSGGIIDFVASHTEFGTETSHVTGNITLNAIDAGIAHTAQMTHNDGSAPLVGGYAIGVDTGVFHKTSGTYVAGVKNYFIFDYRSSNRINYIIYQ